MPKYEVVKSPGLQYPVGYEFETDNLHPSMEQHVRMIGRKSVEPVEPEPEAPTEPEKVVTKPARAKPESKPKDEDDDNT